MNAWSREDIIIAYALYCVTPLNQINPTNRAIQQVSEIIPHSVASIVMRMKNFRFLDPSVASGLGHVAKADKRIYEEFKHDWGALSIEAEQLTGLALFDASPIQGAKPLSSLTDHSRVSRERHFFKRAVLSAYDSTCYISGCRLPRMLIASHIKPYSACRDESERVNPENGICLNTFYDKAFDSGLMTITPSRKVHISPIVKTLSDDEFTRLWLVSLEGMILPPPDLRRVESIWSTTTTKFSGGVNSHYENSNLRTLQCRSETDGPKHRRSSTSVHRVLQATRLDDSRRVLRPTYFRAYRRAA